MNFFVVTVFTICWSWSNAFTLQWQQSAKDNDTLELLHVIFRHGDRNPDQGSLYPSNPYFNESFYPDGYGQLTQNGKRTEYYVGTYLRERYNKFLGKTWNIKYLDVRTTDYNRTKMSAELMLAGLWPPRGLQVWLPWLLWQPIPYNVVPLYEDKVLFPFGGCSIGLFKNLAEVLLGEEISSYLQRYNHTFDVLSKNTGAYINIFTAYGLYFGLLTQEQLGYPLEEWTKEIYPEPLHSAAVDFYYIATNTTTLRRIMAGYFLRKVLSDTKDKINGTLSPSERKMFIYSAHEINVATLLLSLEAFNLVDVPTYGSYVLIEVHKVNEVYGLKLFYQDYENSKPQAIKIRGCGYFCPYDDFYSLVEEILPESDAECNGSAA